MQTFLLDSGSHAVSFHKPNLIAPSQQVDTNQEDSMCVSIKTSTRLPVTWLPDHLQGKQGMLRHFSALNAKSSMFHSLQLMVAA